MSTQQNSQQQYFDDRADALLKRVKELSAQIDEDTEKYSKEMEKEVRDLEKDNLGKTIAEILEESGKRGAEDLRNLIEE